MASTNLERQLRFIARQHERGLRLHRLWLSSDQHESVRSLLRGGPTNGHDSPSSAELAATREALRQAQAEASAQLEKARADLNFALARIRDLEAENVQMSHRLRICQVSLADAQRAVRVGIVGLFLLGLVAAILLFLR